MELVAIFEVYFVLSLYRRNPLLLNGSVDVKPRNGSTNSSSGNAFIDCTLESLAAEDLKNEVIEKAPKCQLDLVHKLCHFLIFRSGFYRADCWRWSVP